MIGLVFAFEDERRHERLPTECSEISSAAVGALAAAIQGDSRIQFEELTDRSSPRPKFAVIFSDLGLVDLFTARLTLALQPSGLRITNVRAIKDTPARDEGADALERPFA